MSAVLNSGGKDVTAHTEFKRKLVALLILSYRCIVTINVL